MRKFFLSGCILLALAAGFAGTVTGTEVISLMGSSDVSAMSGSAGGSAVPSTGQTGSMHIIEATVISNLDLGKTTIGRPSASSVKNQYITITVPEVDGADYTDYGYSWQSDPGYSYIEDPNAPDYTNQSSGYTDYSYLYEPEPDYYHPGPTHSGTGISIMDADISEAQGAVYAQSPAGARLYKITAEETILNVSLAHTSFDMEGTPTGEDTLFQTQTLYEGQYLFLSDIIPEGFPFLIFHFQSYDGSWYSYYISESGRDGSLLLLDAS